MGVVIQRFWCKVEKKIYEVGDEYNGKRLEELAQKGYVEVIEKPKQTKRKAKDDEQAVK